MRAARAASSNPRAARPTISNQRRSIGAGQPARSEKLPAQSGCYREASAGASSAGARATHTATRTVRAAVSNPRAARPSISNQRAPRGPRSATRGAGQPARNEKQPAQSGCYRTASAGASSAGARAALRGPHKYQRQCGSIRLASPMPKQTTCFNHDFFILAPLMMRAIKCRPPPRAVSLREPELPPGCIMTQLIRIPSIQGSPCNTGRSIAESMHGRHPRSEQTALQPQFAKKK